MCTTVIKQLAVQRTGNTKLCIRHTITLNNLYYYYVHGHYVQLNNLDWNDNIGISLLLLELKYIFLVFNMALHYQLYHTVL